jgi:hypothetical protein
VQNRVGIACIHNDVFELLDQVTNDSRGVSVKYTINTPGT